MWIPGWFMDGFAMYDHLTSGDAAKPSPAMLVRFCCWHYLTYTTSINLINGMQHSGKSPPMVAHYIHCLRLLQHGITYVPAIYMIVHTHNTIVIYYIVTHWTQHWTHRLFVTFLTTPTLQTLHAYYLILQTLVAHRTQHRIHRYCHFSQQRCITQNHCEQPLEQPPPRILGTTNWPVDTPLVT